MNGYGIYLMIQLAQELNLISKELEYDLAWEQGTKLHQEFVGGDFDDSHEPEYECMIEFLKSKGGEDTTIICTCSECGSRNVELRQWVNQYTGQINGHIEDDDTWCNDCEEHNGVKFKILKN